MDSEVEIAAVESALTAVDADATWEDTPTAVDADATWEDTPTAVDADVTLPFGDVFDRSHSD